MTQFNSSHPLSGTPPQRFLPVLQKLKAVYLVWHEYHQSLPKTHRHSIGGRVDTLLVEAMEAIAIASFLTPGEKQPYVRVAIRKIDTAKLFLLILWETKSLDNKKYIALSEKIDEVGRQLGGWNGQLTKTLQRVSHSAKASRDRQDK